MRRRRLESSLGIVMVWERLPDAIRMNLWITLGLLLVEVSRSSYRRTWKCQIYRDLLSPRFERVCKGIFRKSNGTFKRQRSSRQHTPCSADTGSSTLTNLILCVTFTSALQYPFIALPRTNSRTQAHVWDEAFSSTAVKLQSHHQHCPPSPGNDNSRSGRIILPR